MPPRVPPPRPILFPSEWTPIRRLATRPTPPSSRRWRTFAWCGATANRTTPIPPWRISAPSATRTSADVLRDALARAGVEPPRRFELPPEAHPDAVIDELDIPEAYNVFLPGEDLPYRLLDGFVVCRADDHGAPEAVDREDAEEGADREGTSAAAIEGDIGSDGTLSAPSTSPRLAAFGWVCAPDAKTLEPVDDPPEGVDSPIPPEQRRTRRVAVWLPRGDRLEHRLRRAAVDVDHHPTRVVPRAGAGAEVWRRGAGARRKIRPRAAAPSRASNRSPRVVRRRASKVLHPPPKPGKPRGRPPKDRSGRKRAPRTGARRSRSRQRPRSRPRSRPRARRRYRHSGRRGRGQGRGQGRLRGRLAGRLSASSPRPPRRRPTFPPNRAARPRRSVGATADASTPRWSSSRSARSSSASSKPPSRPGTSRRPPARSVVT